MNPLISSFIIMLVIDSIYLTFIGGPSFKAMLYDIQNEKMKIKIHSTLIVYLLMMFLLNKFIINEKKSPFDAFILGSCVYGVFDFTNYAIFNNYTLFISIIDTLWGGILFYSVTYLSYKLK